MIVISLVFTGVCCHHSNSKMYLEATSRHGSYTANLWCRYGIEPAHYTCSQSTDYKSGSTITFPRHVWCNYCLYCARIYSSKRYTQPWSHYPSRSLRIVSQWCAFNSVCESSFSPRIDALYIYRKYWWWILAKRPTHCRIHIGSYL